MDKYTEANHKLSKLLDCDSYLWCQDNSAAFALMVKHGISLDILDDCVEFTNNFPFYETEKYSDHPSKEAAIRFAIVRAVIDKLSQQTQEGGKNG